MLCGRNKLLLAKTVCLGPFSERLDDDGQSSATGLGPSPVQIVKAKERPMGLVVSCITTVTDHFIVMALGIPVNVPDS